MSAPPCFKNACGVKLGSKACGATTAASKSVFGVDLNVSSGKERDVISSYCRCNLSKVTASLRVV